MPYITSKPFIEQLQQGSPDAFYTMAWEALDQPTPNGQTVGDWLLQQKYGLDPALLDTYKQIQTPNDAARYLQQTGVSPDELTYIPEQFHDAYKSFDAADRQHLQDLSIDDESRVLARLSERKELIESQKFREEIRTQQEQAKQLETQRWEQGIQQQAMQLISSKREAAIQSQMQQLQKFTPFGPDNAPGNQMVYDDILRSADVIFDNPQIAQKANTAGNLYYQYQRYMATGNTMLASKTLAEADRASLELQREWAKAATQRMNQWSDLLKGRIAAAPSQSTQLSAPHATPSQNQTNQPRPAQPPIRQGFGLSPDKINQIAAGLMLKRNGAA